MKSSTNDMENKSKLEVDSGNWKLKTGKSKVGNGNSKFESRKSKVESRNLRSLLRKLSSFHFQISIFKFLFSNFKFPFSTFLLTLALQTNAQVISLDSVLQRIKAENHMLLEYDIKIDAQEAYAAGAKSWMAPMIGAGTFMTPYPNQTVEHENDKGAIMFSLEQTIPNPAKLNANKKYLASRAAVQEQGRSWQFNALRAEAKTVYYQWILAEKKMKVLKENERILDMMLKLSRIRYPYNQGSLGSIYKTEGRLHEVQNMMLMTLADIDKANYRLKTLMSLPLDANIMVDTSMNVSFELSQITDDTVALRARSDVKQLDKAIEVMRLNQQLQRFQAKPDFKIRFDHMQPLGDMPVQFTAMAMVSIPIAPWSSKMYKSEVKGMGYDIEAMKHRREAILMETQGMLAEMSAQLTRMQRQLDNYDTKIIPALKKNYETVMIAYEENREQLPMVMDGWEALNMTQMEYLNKLEEYYNMIVSYEKELEK